MTSTTNLSSFPSIQPDEFDIACEQFETRCHDRLAGTDWLSVHWDGTALRIKKFLTLLEHKDRTAAKAIPRISDPARSATDIEEDNVGVHRCEDEKDSD